MNNMITKSLVSLAIGALCVGAFAQSAGPTGGQLSAPIVSKPAHRANMLQVSNMILKKMDLTPDQRSKIADLTKKVMGEMKELRADKGLDKAARQDKNRAIQMEYRDGLRGILTPDQQKRYADLLKDYRKCHGANAKPPTTAGGGGTPPIGH